MRRRAPDVVAGHRQAERGRLGRGQRRGRPGGAARAGRRRARATRSGAGWSACSSRRRTSPFDAYVAKLAESGGIVEERIVGEELRSPSVQLRVTPGGDVELLSTHDQLLGGPSGRATWAVAFPADFAYARAISAEAMSIGERLARKGVLGRFALDFVVVKDPDGSWTPVRDRAEPAQGRHDPSVPHPAVPDRRPVRRRHRPVPHAGRPGEAPRGHRPPGVAAVLRAEHRRPVRHRRPARAALRPVPPGRRRLPHDQLPDRARPGRA